MLLVKTQDSSYKFNIFIYIDKSSAYLTGSTDLRSNSSNIKFYFKNVLFVQRTQQVVST